MTAQTMNVNAVIEKAKFKPFHILIVFWCLLIVLFDGYDLAINGVTLPLIMQEWSLNSVQGGMLASSALCGMMFGAMMFGMIADKIGRKNVILICVTLFSGFTFWGGFASSPVEFGILRFIAGLGIGGVLPNLVALTYEYSPQRLRSTLVTTMFSGYAVGGVLSALIGKWLIVEHGWQIMFYIAGIPLLLLPVIWKFLPESVTFLVKKQRFDEARNILNKISPEYNIDKNTRFELEEVQASEASVAELFKQGRGFSTVMFWCGFFMCLLVLYALGSWLPKLMIAAGYSMGTSLMFLLSMNIGGVIGVIIGGMLSDRYHIKPVIIFLLLMGALALFGLGFNSPPFILYLLVAIAGASALGSSILLYSYVADYYPLSVRSTGIGTASAVGRIGAIVGPVVMGVLLTMELAHQLNFIAVAIPALIGTIAVALVRMPKRLVEVKSGKDNKHEVSLSP